MISPSPYRRTESVEISSPESADVCIICFPVFESKLYTTIEPKVSFILFFELQSIMLLKLLLSISWRECLEVALSY